MSLPPCQNECDSDSGVESPIHCSVVKMTHQICTKHGLMRTNGELRFRLNSLGDGSSYIRTQTSSESGGWQNEHFHVRMRETYIVERGWIGYAELTDAGPSFRKVTEGQLFTTSPNVVHNIFMPPEAVIHTVKHNGGVGKDWHSDARCAVLKAHIGESAGSFPPNIPPASSPPDSPPTAPLYTEGYRHFDNLIWQVPAWSSALFAAIVASVNGFLTPTTSTPSVQASDMSSNLIAARLGFSSEVFAAVQLVAFGLFLLAMYYALHRFRWHQLHAKSWGPTGSSPAISPQTALQLLVAFQATLLFVGAAILLHAPTLCTWILATIALCGVTCWSWWHLDKAERRIRPPRFKDEKNKYPIQGGS